MKNAGILLGAVVFSNACAVSASSELPDFMAGTEPADSADAQAGGAGGTGGTGTGSETAKPVVPTLDAGSTGAATADGGTGTPLPPADAGASPGPVPTPVTTPGTPGVPSGSACGAAVCNDGPAGTGATCEQAITIGRGSLLNGSPEYPNSNESSGADQDLAQAGCNDEGNDVFYRIYLYPGEVLTLSVHNRTSDRDIVVKFYFGADCTPPTNVVCSDQGGKGIGEYVYQQPALGQGWHYIVVDGLAGAGGQFTISEAAPLATVTNACSC